MYTNHYSINESTMRRRFDLRKNNSISDRLEKSPNITERYNVSSHLFIHYAHQDVSIIPLIEESLLDAYHTAKAWFDYPNDLTISLWMAPEVRDLQYMVCFQCADSCFFAPGERDGMNIVLFVSPLSCPMNNNRIRLTSLLAHEITHHVICHLSFASRDTRKRKQSLDVPMWLEEGLCQLLQCEVHPSIKEKLIEATVRISQCYDLEDLWNDFSSCSDMNSAYLQAFLETQQLMKKKGKAEIIKLLSLNRDHKTDWSELTKSCART